jgi:acetyl esterase/lipase
MANASYTPPGRLGDPNMTLLTDPRTHPKIRQAIQGLGAGPNAAEFPKQWSIESLTPSIAASEAGVTGLYEMLKNDLPTDADEPAIDISEQTIKGVDGNDIKVYIYKPASAQDPLPAVFYLHGGAMVSGPLFFATSSSEV